MILVTGGTGFLGQNLLPILVEGGYAVRVVTRTPQAYPWLDALPVEVFCGDVEDAEAMRQAAEGCRYIIHAAGLFRFWGQPEAFRETNLRGTLNMLEAARHAGAEKLVHMSTIAVAGYPTDPTQVIDEKHPPKPFDAYQQSKLDGERMALDYHQEHGLPVVIVRGGAFYGPHGRYGFNQVFIEDPLFNHLPLGVNRGRHLMFPAYIKDVARGLLLGLEQGQAGHIYNISSQVMTHREIIAVIARESGTSPFRVFVPQAVIVPFVQVMTWLSNLLGRELHFVRNMEPYTFGEWNVSIQKAQRELGYQPTPFEVGIRETLDWYAAIGVWKRS